MCATSKPSNRNLGLYTPLAIPSRPWESVSMDFFGGLSKSRKGHDYLYVVVDRSSKMCILTPCNKHGMAEQTAKLFFQNVWVHFGLPTFIVSVQDSRFVGKFWSSLWELMDTRLNKSTTLHPQVDGQTKVVNRTMIQLLRGYCSKHPKLWMSICVMCNMLTTMQNILLLRDLILRLVWVLYQSLPWILSLVKT